MNKGTEPKDVIDAAIAATNGEAESVQMWQVQLNFGTTGRPFVLAVPMDLTYEEHLDLIHWIAHPRAGLAPALEKARNKPVIEVAHSIPPRMRQ